MRENAFQNILDDNTAYWLGFLTADGSISKTTIQIGLANKDKEHLEKLRDFLEVDRPINERYVKCTNGKEYLTNYLTFSSRKMVDDLSQYSIVAGKTYLDVNFLSFIKEEYQFPYICGYLDGDGWIVHTQKARSFGMCGNQKTIDAIRNYLNDRYGWSLNLLQDKRSKQTYSFQTESNIKLTQFLNDYCGMAEKCNLLERKYQNAIGILEDLSKKGVINNHKDKVIKDKTIADDSIFLTCPICGTIFPQLYPNQKYCSQKCSHINQQRVERPNREIFKSEIRSIPFLQIGKKYGVSDNTIRKWCKFYGLPYQTAVIKKMTDEEWEKT